MATENRASRQRQQNAKNARRGKYPDANKDGVPDRDTLDKEQLAREYQSAIGIIYSVPEIKPIFEQAVAEGWDVGKFTAAVQNSDWYRNNNEYARRAWAQENIGGPEGADWKVRQENARNAVRIAAADMGADLTEQEIASLTRRYLYEGWDDSTRAPLMMQALSEQITFLPDERGGVTMKGKAGSFSDELRSLSRANGMAYSDSYYLSAARSVASGLSTEDDWRREIQEQAASRYPVYADKIRSGMSVYDLASPYIQTMAQEFEISPDNITLNDPYITQALTALDDKGTPVPLGLWDFQKKLRNDPRWMNTSKAQNEITSVTGRVMQMFGLMAG